MNATDQIAVGLVLVAGGVWLDATNLPGAELPVVGVRVHVVGVCVLIVAVWRVGRGVLVGGRR